MYTNTQTRSLFARVLTSERKTHQVVRGDGVAGRTGRDHHGAQPLAHVVQTRRQGQHRHDLTGHRDVKLRLQNTSLV